MMGYITIVSRIGSINTRIICRTYCYETNTLMKFQNKERFNMHCIMKIIFSLKNLLG